MATEIGRLRRELKNWREYFHGRSIAWSLVHHVTAFGAAIASAIIGFLIQRPTTWTLWGANKDEFSTWLALLAAILATIAATGGFERKWRSCRLSRSRIDLLRIDLTEPQPDLEAIRLRLKGIITNHDGAIVGFLREAEPEAGSLPASQAQDNNSAAHSATLQQPSGATEPQPLSESITPNNPSSN